MLVKSEPDPLNQLEPNTETFTEEHNLSLNALKSGMGVGIIRILAQINGYTIKVLVDEGSSHNFL